MRNIVITTESGNDLPKHLVEKYNIHVAPMYITMGDRCCADCSVPVEEVYQYYKDTGKVPSTSAVNVGDFQTIFEEIRKEDPDCVIFHLAYSAVTTCSYQNAKIAADHLELEDVYLVDGKNVTGGSTAFIVKACEYIRKIQPTLDETPESYEQLVKKLESMADKVHFSFLPGNLDYLKAGGRVSNAAYLGGTLLKIKPLIELKDGKLVATRKYRGSMERLAEQFITEFVETNRISREYLYMVATGGISETVRTKMFETAKKLGFKGYELNPCGLVITCHSGPASIGVGGWETDLENI